MATNGTTNGTTNGRRTSEGANGKANGNGRGRPQLGATKVVRLAVEQLAELTGRVAEGVSELSRVDDGWSVTVEVVELERIPSSTDVLGSYEVVLDEDGDLLEYRRVARWVRSQPRED